MKVRNYVKLIAQDSEKHIDLNPLAPQWPFRALIVGSSGSGKTNMVLDLILNHIYYDKIYIYAKNLDQPIYEFLEEFLNKAKDEGELIDYSINSELNEDLKLDNFDNDGQTLIIFDDFITEKDQHLISDLFVRGRHKNISTIYISQSYMDIPKLIRKNSNYLALYKDDDLDNVKRVLKKNGGSNPDKMLEMYIEATMEPYSFFFIDMKTNDKMLRFRRNWDGVIAE
jgi:hypothetical protein